MTEIVIRQNSKPLQFAGGIFALLGIPLTLLSAFFAGSVAATPIGFLAALLGPLLLGFGLWLAFRSQPATVWMTLSDEVIKLARPDVEIPLHALTEVNRRRPFLGNYDKLVLRYGANEVSLNVIHLTHDSRDIMNLIGIRLEKQGKSLTQTTGPVSGAPTGIWQVREGIPFAVSPAHDMSGHG